MKQLRRLHREEPRFRLQPSRRGVATVFVLTAALGAGVGLAFVHWFT